MSLFARFLPVQAAEGLVNQGPGNHDDYAVDILDTDVSRSQKRGSITGA